MKTITLQSSASLIEVDLIGASIVGLKLDGVEISWSGTRPDGGNGVTHPCIPNFNLAAGLPNHGPARKEEWRQIDETTFTWSMAEIEGEYAKGIEATRTFHLAEHSLVVSTIISNQSDEDLPINIAEHNYFSCNPELRSKVRINNKLFDQDGLNANAKYLPIGGNELIIEIPELPKLKMTVEGYTAFAQWSQPDAPFVCIEPIQVLPPEPETFMETAPRIRAGETKTFRYKVEIME